MVRGPAQFEAGALFIDPDTTGVNGQVTDLVDAKIGL